MYYRIPGPYKGYGHDKRRRRLVFFAVLAGLCVLAVSAFFILQNYLVFSADGVRLEFPFLQSKNQNDTTPGDSDAPPLEVETPEPGGTETPPNETQTPPEATNVPETVLHAVLADVSKLSDGEYRRDLMSLPGVNAIVVDLKNPDGSVTYRSTAAVEGARENASDAVSEAIREFTENGIYVIGRMSAFRDNIAPRTAMRSSAVKTASGATWLDYKSIGWFNPYREGTAQYLSALAKEASELGCNELMFYNFCFPISGKTELISYSDTEGVDRTTAVNTVLDKISKALSGSDMVLSVTPENSALPTGKDEKAGQDIRMLADLSGRIYFDASDAQSEALFDSLKWDQIVSGAFDDGKIVPVLQSNENNRPLSALPETVIDKCGYVLVSDDGEYTPTNFSQ